MDNVPLSIMERFEILEDPRTGHARRHELLDIIVITLCAVICGADNWVEIEEFGKAKEEWFRRFLKLPHGIPSHDTFGRVFSLLDPEQFSACFMDWVRSVRELAHGDVVAIDGKTLRRCHDRANGRGPLHMVSAWATEHRMVLGQTRTEAHSNEITAIPQLLKVLELKGCLATIDAMGGQKNIARQVVRGGADYLLAVKANQSELYENIKDLFAGQERAGWDGVAYSHHEQLGKGHGRLERRQCWVITDPEELAYVDPQRQWASSSAVARVNYRRDIDTGSPDLLLRLGYLLLHLQLSGGRGPAAGSGAEPLEHREQPALGLGHGFRRGSQSCEDGPCRPEPGGDATPGTQPAQAGTQC